jgi:hypothetical protein
VTVFGKRPVQNSHAASRAEEVGQEQASAALGGGLTGSLAAAATNLVVTQTKDVLVFDWTRPISWEGVLRGAQ